MSVLRVWHVECHLKCFILKCYFGIDGNRWYFSGCIWMPYTVWHLKWANLNFSFVSVERACSVASHMPFKLFSIAVLGLLETVCVSLAPAADVGGAAAAAAASAGLLLLLCGCVVMSSNMACYMPTEMSFGNGWKYRRMYFNVFWIFWKCLLAPRVWHVTCHWKCSKLNPELLFWDCWELLECLRLLLFWISGVGLLQTV